MHRLDSTEVYHFYAGAPRRLLLLLVGQTLMPEAALAREAGLSYAALCPIVNHAAGLGDSEQGISRAELTATRAVAMERVSHILLQFAGGA